MIESKRYLTLILAVTAILLSCITTYSQNAPSALSRFDIGIENTRLIFGQYTYKDHYTARINVSAYSEKPGYQYVRASFGYKRSLSAVNLEGKAFFGSAFNGSYYNTGAIVSADTRLAGRLLLDAVLAPWYDSGFGYTTCWEAKIGCVITNHIDIKAGYTTLPEYRMDEKRVLFGFDFHVSQLYVEPYLSIGTKASDGGKNIRVVFGFGYRF